MNACVPAYFYLFDNQFQSFDRFWKNQFNDKVFQEDVKSTCI